MFSIEFASNYQHRAHYKILFVTELAPLSKKNRNFTPDRMSDPSGESHDITGKFLGHCSIYVYKT